MKGAVGVVVRGLSTISWTLLLSRYSLLVFPFTFYDWLSRLFLSR